MSTLDYPYGCGACDQVELAIEFSRYAGHPAVHEARARVALADARASTPEVERIEAWRHLLAVYASF